MFFTSLFPFNGDPDTDPDPTFCNNGDPDTGPETSFHFDDDPTFIISYKIVEVCHINAHTAPQIYV
jgi:hypothetical protein